MKDIFGNAKPVAIEVGEWWFNGRFIQKQSHPLLQKYWSFADDDGYFVATHDTFKEATKYALDNPCQKPKSQPSDYIGGL